MPITGNGSCTGRSWLVPPFLFLLGIVMLVAVWANMQPAAVAAAFDMDGRSPFELATLPFYAAIVPLVWMKCPYYGSKRRRATLCLMTSIVAIMAIVKELDLHNAFLHAAYPAYVGEDGSLLPGLFKPNGDALTGTPFKMRVLTNNGVPPGMKIWIFMYFALFFGLFAGGFAYLFRMWVMRVLALRPDAWAVGCFGASGVMVQIADRLPSWLRSSAAGDGGTRMDEKIRALCTVLEEGGEMMIAIFAILAILYASAARRRRLSQR